MGLGSQHRLTVLGLGPAYTNLTSVLTPTQVGTASNWVKVIAWPGKFGAGIQSDGTLWAWGSTDLPSFIRAGYADTNTLISNYANGTIATSPAATGIPGPWVDLSLGNSVYRQGIVALRTDGTLWASKLPDDNSPATWAYLLPWLQTQSADPNSLYSILINSGMSPTDALRYLLVTYYSWSPAMAAALDYDAMLQANSDANILESYSTRGGWVMVDTGISLNQDGTIWTSGDNSSAARSPGSPRDGDWQRVNADTDWRCVRSGFAGVKTDGHIWTWGAGGSSAYLLGNGCVGSATDLTKIPGTNRWMSARQDGTHVVALDTQRNLWVWGGNTSGELGLGDNEPRLAPTQLPLAGPWLDYALVSGGTVAVRQNGEFWVWGNYNATGTNLPSPLRLKPERPWRSLFTSGNQGYALAQDGTLWAFGYNISTGNLGLGITSNTIIAVPQQLAGSNWCFVSPSLTWYHTLAVQTDGTLWAWGRNSGDLGLPYVPGQALTSPVLVPGGDWRSVAAGCGEGFGIRSDGTLWAWGGGSPTATTNDLQYPTSYVFESTLGIPSLNSLINARYWDCVNNPGNSPPRVYLATTSYVSTPVQVGADTDWKVVYSANQYYPTKLALKQDGSLWLWGMSPFASVTNTEAYLTPATHPYPNVPYPVNVSMLPVPQRVGTNLWSSLDLPNTAAVTTSGDLYLWGQNQNGQLLLPPAWLPQPVLSNVVCRVPPVIP